MDTNTLLQQIKNLEQMILQQQADNNNRSNNNSMNTSPMISTNDGETYNGVSEWRKQNIEYAREYDRLSRQKKKINDELRELQKKHGIAIRAFPKSYNRKKA